MKTPASPKLALLIDADNLSPNDVEAVFDYLASEGYQLPVRRAYGGYEKLSGMKEVLRQRAVRALVNQGKGTTDVSLTVDAMDLLYGLHLPPTVAVVSSDADFAPLALRLRESDIRVLCFANHRNSTPSALAIAYDKVVFVDDLGKSNSETVGVPIKRAADEAPIDQCLSIDVVEVKVEKLTPVVLLSTEKTDPHVEAVPPKQKAVADQKLAPKPTTSVVDDLAKVRRILEVLPGWLPNTVKNLNQMGGPLRASGIAKGSKPLHELFRKHPGYFKVVPTTGPAKQIKLLKLPI